MDRAGLVGADGPTHAGSFDVAYLGCLPNMTIMAAADEAELVHMVATAAAHDSGPIRAALPPPRGEGVGVDMPERGVPLEIGRGRVMKQGSRVAILSLGTRLAEALKAAEELDARGLSTTVADARFAKPLDLDLVGRLAREHEVLITIEEGSIGGFGSFVLHALADAGLLDKGLKVRAMVSPRTSSSTRTSRPRCTPAPASTPTPSSPRCSRRSAGRTRSARRAPDLAAESIPLPPRPKFPSRGRAFRRLARCRCRSGRTAPPVAHATGQTTEGDFKPMRNLYLAAAAAAALLAPNLALAQGGRGRSRGRAARFFNQCRACHQVGDNARNLVSAPSLNDLLRPRIGDRRELQFIPRRCRDFFFFFYDVTWTHETFRTYIKDPRGEVPGTKHGLRGVQDDERINGPDRLLSSSDSEELVTALPSTARRSRGPIGGARNKGSRAASKRWPCTVPFTAHCV